MHRKVCISEGFHVTLLVFLYAVTGSYHIVAARATESVSESASMNLRVLTEDVSVLSSFCLMPRCFGYLALALVMTSKSQELLVLPGHEVDGGVFQQSGEDEEEAHRHPDVYSLHIGDLNTQTHTSGKCTHFSAISKSRTKNNHIYYI